MVIKDTWDRVDPSNRSRERTLAFVDSGRALDFLPE